MTDASAEPLPDASGEQPPWTRDLFRHGSVYTAGTALQMLAGALTLPVVTRLLTTNEYGELASAMVAMQVVIVVAGLGLPGAITREVFDGERDEGISRARGLIWVAACSAFVIATMAHLSGGWWSGILSDLSYSRVLVVAVWISVPTTVLLATQSVHRALAQPGRFILVSMISSIGGQLAGIAALAWLGAGAPGFLLGCASGTAVAAAFSVVLVRPTGRGFRDMALVRSALRVGLPTVPHSLGLFVMAAGDRLLVGRYLGLEEVGRYQVAYLVGSLPIVVLAALNNSWAPLIYGEPRDRRWATLAETTQAVVKLACLAAIGLVLVAPLVLRLAAPARYELDDLLPTTALVSLGVVPYALYLSSSAVLGSVRRTEPLAYITPAATALNIGLNVALVPALGLEGAAIASVVSYAAWATAVRGVANRLGTVPWNRRVLVTWSCVAGTLVGIGGWVLPPDGGGLVARAILALAVIPIGLRVMRGFS